MSGRIFAIDSKEELIEMNQERYISEDLFQNLIEKYPNILAGEQINPDFPRQWILISREMGIPSEQSGSNQWFIDHLFIDQDSIPTFVEVKRSTDTRIRREVVAQMLDYAANASMFWPMETIRNLYLEQLEKRKSQPLADIGIGPDKEDAYWQNVQTNLKAGKMRLLFVADEIPMSLQRIIEFLNEQMTNTEVLGLEIKQFVSKSGYKTLVPRIIGRTAAAAQIKQAQGSSLWDEDSFLADITAKSGIDAEKVCRNLISGFEQLGCQIRYVKGKSDGMCYIFYNSKVSQQLCAITSTKKPYISLYFANYKAPYDAMEKRREMKSSLEGTLGISIPDDKLNKYPSFTYTILEKPGRLKVFHEIYAGFIADVRKYEEEQCNN